MSVRRRRTDGARILVVEDHADFRLLLQWTLQDAGYLVDCAATSEDAVRMLAGSRYSLVLTDYSLPGHSGAWLVTHASAAHAAQRIPSMIVTGDPDAPGIPGDVTVVRKPVDFDQLLAQVRAIVANTSTACRVSRPASRYGEAAAPTYTAVGDGSDARHNTNAD
jgi:DNA-binding response OmpR family regulator